VFWGSQSGTAEGFANRLARDIHARFGVGALSADLSDYDSETISLVSSTHIAIFILSTFGEGDPSDNAFALWDWVHKNDDPLPDLRYFAFGLGNRNYKYYNRVVDVVSDGLSKRGAKLMMPVGKADDAEGTTEEDFISWKDDLFTVLKEKLGLEEKELKYEPSLRVLNEPCLDDRALSLGAPVNHGAVVRLGATSSAIERIPVQNTHELFNSSTRNCIHMELDISTHPTLRYKTGDHIAVFPINPEVEVDLLLQMLDLSEHRKQSISIRSLDPSFKPRLPTATTTEALFKHYLEICAPVSRDSLLNLAQFAPTPAAKVFINNISRDKAGFNDLVSRTHLTFGRLLHLAVGSESGLNWSKLPLSLAIESIPSLQPRFYSISSSSVISPKKPSITALVSKDALPHAPESFIYGVTSNYMRAVHEHSVETPDIGYKSSDCQSYDVSCAKMSPQSPIHLYAQIRRSKFRLPMQESKPIIMIGAGTGVAPFRAFIAERVRLANMNRPLGEMLLFFGCRTPEEDYIYKEEFEKAQAQLNGKLSITMAFSRVDNVYVQDRIREQAQNVIRLLDDGANLYICGRAAMAREVGKVVADSMGKCKSWNETETREWSESIRRRGTWQEDVWG
jgi:NADPH-ferrihemoprotein reductase